MRQQITQVIQMYFVHASIVIIVWVQIKIVHHVIIHVVYVMVIKSIIVCIVKVSHKEH